LGHRNKGRQVNGILLLNKALGVSSNKALQEVKHLYHAAKAGHTGTLDPLATGVLPICFGEATKFTQFLLDADKKYSATIRFGISTSSGDAESKIVSEPGAI
jgi:tRNA pseudouridine55 synthase